MQLCTRLYLIQQSLAYDRSLIHTNIYMYTNAEVTSQNRNVIVFFCKSSPNTTRLVLFSCRENNKRLAVITVKYVLYDKIVLSFHFRRILARVKGTSLFNYWCLSKRRKTDVRADGCLMKACDSVIFQPAEV